jgi:hypothetical protein
MSTELHSHSKKDRLFVLSAVLIEKYLRVKEKTAA